MPEEANQNFDPGQCPNCGARLPQGAGSCPACGAPLAAAQVPTAGGAAGMAPSELAALLERSNQTLVNAGTNAAEAAFGLGCSLGVILGSLLLVVLFLLGQRNWIFFAIVFMGAALVALAASVALAGRARSATIRGTFEREVHPEIDRLSNAQAVTRQQLVEQAQASLPDDAPLWAFLSSPGDGISSTNYAKDGEDDRVR